MRDDFILGSVKTYAMNTKKLLKLYEKHTGEPAPKLQGPPKQRYQAALNLIDKASFQVDDSLPIADIDDIPPNTFFDAMYETITSEPFNKNGDYELRHFLRRATSAATQEMGATKRLNIGDNFHFQRMFQYVREFEEWAAEDELGFGLKVLNAAGAGAVAQYPSGPDKLVIRVWHE
ncbi:hypothetical protein [Leisingera sp. ANG-S5]|uniref:hypothetical protein n=1 Tax=Leisingera sp. ANG-S5 TaxID=1577901 RepID=UPI00057F284B|nr:hypothetical protein [Leisingera sp. ANG-S5]KIC31960.1 hypothetical protein RA25_14550 [Leisingera sp. ANG-S5]